MAPSFTLGLQPAIPADFGTLGVELHLDSTRLAFEDADFFSNNTLATWRSPGLSWSVNQQVSVSLVLPPPRSSNANLSGLTASSGMSTSDTFAVLSLTPSTFSPATTSYAATVANTITHLKLTPTVEDTGKATVTVGGRPVSSGSPSQAIALRVGANAITVRVTAENRSTKDYIVTVTRQGEVPRQTPTVSLSASPNPVTEGSPVTVTARLSSALSARVTIPLTLTDNSAEPGDRGALDKMTIAANTTSGTLTIATRQDADTDDETFTVALDTANLPSSVTAGDPSFVQIRIRDDDGGGTPPDDDGGTPPSDGDDDDDGDDDGDDDDGDDDGDDDSDDDGDDDSEHDDDDGDGDGDSDDDGDGPPRAAIATNAECGETLCRARTDERVSFEDTGSGTVRRRLWDFGDGRTSPSRTPTQAWSEPGFYRVTLVVSDGTVESASSLTFLVEAASPAGTCVADDETRCLGDSRFAVEMDWWTGDGRSGPGYVVHEGTNDSGLFYFFEPGDNWEVLIKVLDGCSVNEHVWVYGASATTLGYTIRVTDTATGAVKEYRNEDGRRADAIADSEAFSGVCGGRSDASTPAPPLGNEMPHTAGRVGIRASTAAGGCTDSAKTLCLHDGRYEVSVSWSKLAASGEESGETGPGIVLRPRTPDSGLFHFFGLNNWEMLVKVLDACQDYGHHWVFAASATDLGLDLVVRDTVTGLVKQYVKDPGEPSPAVADVTAFPDACRAD